MKNLILSLFCLATISVAAQLSSGSYYMSDGNKEMKLEICEGGFEVCDFSINYGDTLIITGKGQWFAVNLNAFKDEEYSGPDGWYTIDIDGGLEQSQIEVDVNYPNNLLLIKDPYTKKRYELRLE